MAKRKNRSPKPNLPTEALERARQQLEETRMETAAPEPQPPALPAAALPAAVPPGRTSTRAERRAAAGGSSRRRLDPEVIQFSQRRKAEVLDNATIEEMLAKPTRFISDEQLRQEYGYVLADLRKMAALAMALMVALVVMAQFI